MGCQTFKGTRNTANGAITLLKMQIIYKQFRCRRIESEILLLSAERDRERDTREGKGKREKERPTLIAPCIKCLGKLWARRCSACIGVARA